MPVNRFAIGQRVRVVRVGDWNGTPPNESVAQMLGRRGTIRERNCSTIGVEMVGYWWNLGVLQFLPDELAVLDESSGGT